MSIEGPKTPKGEDQPEDLRDIDEVLRQSEEEHKRKSDGDLNLDELDKVDPEKPKEGGEDLNLKNLDVDLAEPPKGATDEDIGVLDQEVEGEGFRNSGLSSIGEALKAVRKAKEGKTTEGGVSEDEVEEAKQLKAKSYFEASAKQGDDLIREAERRETELANQRRRAKEAEKEKGTAGPIESEEDEERILKGLGDIIRRNGETALEKPENQEAVKKSLEDLGIHREDAKALFDQVRFNDEGLDYEGRLALFSVGREAFLANKDLKSSAIAISEKAKELRSRAPEKGEERKSSNETITDKPEQALRQNRIKEIRARLEELNRLVQQTNRGDESNPITDRRFASTGGDKNLNETREEEFLRLEDELRRLEKEGKKKEAKPQEEKNGEEAEIKAEIEKRKARIEELNGLVQQTNRGDESDPITDRRFASTGGDKDLDKTREEEVLRLEDEIRELEGKLKTKKEEKSEGPLASPVSNASEEKMSASVPFMITKDMKNRLSLLGYSEEEVRKMTPDSAHQILNKSEAKADSEIETTEAEPVSAVEPEEIPRATEGTPEGVEGTQSIEEFYYQVTTNDSEGSMPEGFEVPEGVRPEIEKLYGDYNHLVDSHKKEAQIRAKVKKSGGTKFTANFEEALAWRENSEKVFEKSMDAYKLKLVKDFRERKLKDFPDLTEEEINKEMSKYGVSIALQQATNVYGKLENDKVEAALEAREKGLFGRMWQRYSSIPRHKRVLASMAVAAGVGAGTAFMLGSGGLIGAAALYAGSRGLRSTAAGLLAGGVQKVADKFFISKKYHTKRTAARGMAKEELLEKVQAGVGDTSKNWLEDTEKALAIIQMIDADAKELTNKLRDIDKKEGRAQMKVALASGIGSALLVAGVDWERILAGGLPDLPDSPEPDIYPPLGPLDVPSADGSAEATEILAGGTLSPEDSTPFDGEAIPVAAQEFAESGDILTINEGDSLWSTARGLVNEGVITEEEFKEGWGNSVVEVVRNGETVEVPIHEVGLIHPGDQFEIIRDGGDIRFNVEDFAEDRLEMGSNQDYYNYLKNENKTVPNWLERAVNGSPLDSAISSAGEVIADASKQIIENVPGNNLVVLPEDLFGPEAVSGITKEFNNASLFGQDRTLISIDGYSTTLDKLIHSASVSPDVSEETLQKLKDFKFEVGRLSSGLVGSGEYSIHTRTYEDLIYSSGDVSRGFYDGVKGMKVEDFLSQSKPVLEGSGVKPNVSGLFAPKNEGALRHISTILGKNSPGRPELLGTVDNLIKKQIA